jgi:GNAT superfamily N-acetyltransferase
VRIELFDAAEDPAAARALYEIYLAGAPDDVPGGPPMSPVVFGGLMVQGWCCEPREMWLASPGSGAPARAGTTAGPGPAAGGPVVGGYVLELPDRENQDRAGIWLLVAPGQRRAGIGTALLRHAGARARHLGRIMVTGEAMDGTAGSGFGRAVGATTELTEARRTLDVRAIPAGRLGELRSSVKAASAGYTLLDWSGPMPGAYLDAVARLNEAMHDAPHGAGLEAQRWDAERVRATERRALSQGLRHYSVAAKDERTGELAGLTELSVDPAHPGWGHQELTVVARAHRGHRLGLLLKVAMLELLAEREPQLEAIETYNAETNAHMVGINEMLGYRVTGRLAFWQMPAAAVGGAPGSRVPLSGDPVSGL